MEYLSVKAALILIICWAVFIWLFSDSVENWLEKRIKVAKEQESKVKVSVLNFLLTSVPFLFVISVLYVAISVIGYIINY